MLEGYQILDGEPVVEESIASAQDGFGLLAVAAVEGVGDSGPRGPVVVVGDVVLSLPAKAT